MLMSPISSPAQGPVASVQSRGPEEVPVVECGRAAAKSSLLAVLRSGECSGSVILAQSEVSAKTEGGLTTFEGKSAL
jgi:hypothetical protein